MQVFDLKGRYSTHLYSSKTKQLDSAERQLVNLLTALTQMLSVSMILF